MAAVAAGLLVMRLAMPKPAAPVAPQSSPEPSVVSEMAEPPARPPTAMPPAGDNAVASDPPPMGSEDQVRLDRLRALAGLPSPGASSPERPLEPPPSGPAPAPAPRAATDWLALARKAHILVYTTGWCPVCKRAKAWMDAKGLSYDDRNVEASAEDARTLRRLNPRASIPTFDVDGQTMIGFSEAGFADLVLRAERAR